MRNKNRKTNRNKPRKKCKKNKTKRNKGGGEFSQRYEPYTAKTLIKKLEEIQNEDPNAFNQQAQVDVLDANLDIHHDFAQFRDTYRTWNDFINDIIHFNRSLTARERLRLFSYAFLIYILLPNDIIIYIYR